MVASEIAQIVTYATPYVTAAAGTYSGAVLSRSNDKKTNAMVAVGVRFLERVFGRREDGVPAPEELIDLAKDPDDNDALGAVRRMIRKALEADPGMLADVRSILPGPSASTVTQQVRAGRDAYVSGRDMTINRSAD
jgi:hypothetical protein